MQADAVEYGGTLLSLETIRLDLARFLDRFRGVGLDVLLRETPAQT